MKIYFASDHAGFELSKKLRTYLRGQGYEIENFGAFVEDKNDDYPDFILKAAKAVSENLDALAVVIGGSGQGEAIVANKVKGVRAALFYGGSGDILRLSKEHNNANILSLGARFLTEEEAKKAVSFWLEVKFKGESRHKRRIDKINKIEDMNFK